MMLYDLAQSADRVALGHLTTLLSLKRSRQQQMVKDAERAPTVAPANWNADNAVWSTSPQYFCLPETHMHLALLTQAAILQPSFRLLCGPRFCLW